MKDTVIASINNFYRTYTILPETKRSNDQVAKNTILRSVIFFLSTFKIRRQIMFQQEM